MTTDSEFHDAANRAKAAARNIRPEIFDEIAALSIQQSHVADRQMAQMRAEPGMGMPQLQLVRQRIAAMQLESQDRIHAQVVSHYGAEGEQALSVMNREIGGPSMFESVVKLFYDSDKGGVQFGGLLGAVAGFMGGMTITGGGAGGWLGLAALGITTLSFAWGGKQLGEMISNRFSAPSVGAGSEPAQGQAPAPAQDRAAAPAPTEPEVGQLPSPPSFAPPRTPQATSPER